MGNPFYIPQQQEPKRNDLATILAALKLGIDAYGTWQQGDIAEKKLEATTVAAAQQQAWEERKHADTMASQEATRSQHAVTENAKLPYHQQSYGFGDHMKLALKAKDVGDDANILNFSKQLATDKTVTKLDAWKMFRENDELRQSAIESLTKKVQSASEKGAKEGINYLETKEGQADYQRLQALSDPEIWRQIVDANFQETATSYNNAQAKAKKDASFAPVNVEGVGLVDPNTRGVLMQAKPKPKDSIVTAGRGVYQIGEDGKPRLVATAPQAESTAATWSAPKQDEGGEYQISSKGEKQYTRKDKADAKPTPKTIADAEAKISANMDNEAAASYADIVNQHSKKPYAWVYQGNENSRYIGDRKVWNAGKWGKVKLPNMGGRQVTADEVYFTAEKNGTTYEDVLRKIGAIK